MIKKKNRWTAVYNICWYGMLALIMLLSAFRANINLFEHTDFIPLEWFTANEMQPLFNVITFWALAVLLTVRVIMHIVLKNTVEQADAICFEEIKDQLNQCQQDIKENKNETNELKMMLKKVSYTTEGQYEKTNILLQSAQRDTRGAWNELFAEYCRTAPKLRKMIERTVKGFKQTLERWERKD